MSKKDREKEKIEIDETRYYQKPELLSPAGSKEAFIAAVEAGADAIYLGGKFFNARLKASNFTIEEIEKAVDFAHKRNVRVYITVNTLYSQKEIGKVVEYALRLYEIGVDALIIQDLGLGEVIREIIPDFELHLSTQGSVYDLEGAKEAYRLGFKRVVTARELSKEELKYICENFEGEIESFVHGAMCMSYSGQCQFSRSLGARSGNRGACAQPCRLEYKEEQKTQKNSKLKKELENKGYLLSPSDLNLIDELDELIKIGVFSLKIEGRMKSPEYVARVTSLYRKYIDIIFDEYVSKTTKKRIAKIEKEDKEELLQIFNRGGFSKGFLYGQNKEYMSKEIPKNQGVEIGTVIRELKNNLIEIKLNPKVRLQLGDGIEIRGKGFGSNIITYLKEARNKKAKGINSNYKREISKKNSNKTINKDRNREDICTLVIGDIKTKVYAGDKVFRVVSKKQQEEMLSFYHNKDWDSGKFLRRLPIKIEVKQRNIASGNYCLDFIACVDSFNICLKVSKTVLWDKVNKEDNNDDMPLISKVSYKSNRNKDENLIDKIDEVDDKSNQKKNLLSDIDSLKQKIKNSFRKTGNTPFEIFDITFNIWDKTFPNISMSEINEIRRKLYRELETKIIVSNRPKVESIESTYDGFKRQSQIDDNSLYSVSKALKIDSAIRGNDKRKIEAREDILELYFLNIEDIRSINLDRNTAKYLKKKKLKVRIVLPLVEILETVYKIKEASVETNDKFGLGFLEKFESIETLRKFDIDISYSAFVFPIAKGKEEKYIKRNIKIIKELFSIEREIKSLLENLYIGNLAWVTFCNQNAIKWIADYGFNVFNLYTGATMLKLGAKGFVRSLEKEEQHFNYPLMIMEYPLLYKQIKDRKNKPLEILRSNYVEKSILREKKIYSNLELYKNIRDKLEKKEASGIEITRGIEEEINNIYRIYL